MLQILSSVLILKGNESFIIMSPCLVAIEISPGFIMTFRSFEELTFKGSLIITSEIGNFR